MNTTFFTEADYVSKGFQDAMMRVIDEWGLKYPGVERVEHVYFYAVRAISADARQAYLQEAYRLGKDF